MKKVEDIKRPLKEGELFLVPCIVRTAEKIFITPVINHPHNDIESGQPETHYHVDYRFVKHYSNSEFPYVINRHRSHYYVENIRPQLHIDGELEYIILPVINEDFTGITTGIPVPKNKCKHKGKCPHKGYDLSQVTPVDGVITCPLHGLKILLT